ncbi:DUF1127 domain-containing protein [Pseudooceanicola onchidii]|uniref:DUF1127 domain-containing protein n=1 Tax=Pseudooceanicola onchidii TaxID=2562279 RepID=UPI0010AA9C76|nr:DUF1127 domain-containing protein [Pseudooceanicola onchidii]
MANTTTHIADTGFRSGIAHFFQAFGAGMTAYMERRSRADQIAKLNALSDAELKKIGISREGIPAYVFRDMFYV